MRASRLSRVLRSTSTARDWRRRRSAALLCACGTRDRGSGWPSFAVARSLRRSSASRSISTRAAFSSPLTTAPSTSSSSPRMPRPLLLLPPPLQRPPEPDPPILRPMRARRSPSWVRCCRVRSRPRTFSRSGPLRSSGCRALRRRPRAQSPPSAGRTGRLSWLCARMALSSSAASIRSRAGTACGRTGSAFSSAMRTSDLLDDRTGRTSQVAAIMRNDIVALSFGSRGWVMRLRSCVITWLLSPVR
mmetsp:Transcript_29341/g.75656  ORF Transcript_29341/g.75656 Transcript_29341/m.75656 type:complete len:246 (-) Transcript_29341:318-1055(-)